MLPCRYETWLPLLGSTNSISAFSRPNTADYHCYIYRCLQGFEYIGLVYVDNIK